MSSLGGWKHDVRCLQLQQPAEPSVWLPAFEPQFSGSKGGGGAAGEEVPSCSHPGAPSPDRAHQDSAAEQGKKQGVNANRPEQSSSPTDKKGKKARLSVMFE